MRLKRFVKRAVALTLSATLLTAGLAACGTTETPNDASSNVSDAGVSDEPAGDVDTKEDEVAFDSEENTIWHIL